MSNKVVLTVDDSKVVRTMVSRQLQRYGCTIVEAGNGQEGVEAAKQHHPDLILLDVTMPVMDGRQALAALRKDPETQKTPVIMLTAESGKDLVVEIAKLGVSGYIVKPFEQGTFDKAVSTVIGAPEGATAEASSGSGALATDTVLVIDDSERVLASAKSALEQSLKVLTATSGKDGIAQYKTARPGIVIVDLLMPDMDGFATLAELQKLGKSTFVALAMRGDGTLNDKARKAGFGSIVHKPFTAADLIAVTAGVGAAAGSPDDVLSRCLTEEQGCPVFDLEKSAKVIGKLFPLFAKRLRSLAEDGNDQLILDAGSMTEITSDHVAFLARVLEDAKTLGLRTAICAQAQVTGRLQQIAETSTARYATTRDQARQSLQA